MRSLEKLFLTVLVCFGCYSCKSKEEREHAFEPVELTSPDNGDVMSFKSRGSDNLVDVIYSKLLKKRIELKKLENEINVNKDMQTDSLLQFNNYRNRSSQYYSSALENIKDIKDSVLRKEYKKLIERSKTNYEHKVSAQTTLLADIEKAESNLNDNYAALKILATLPIIEQYQQGEMPDNKKLENLLLEKQKLISRTKKLTSTGD